LWTENSRLDDRRLSSFQTLAQATASKADESLRQISGPDDRQPSAETPTRVHMSRFCACLLALMLSSSLLSAQVGVAPQFPSPPGFPPVPPRDATPKTGTARIRGRVVSADTGQPLRKAQIRLFSPELRENRVATTDRMGMYELADLPAGRYQLTATKGSFVQLQYGQSRPFEPGKPLEIGDGQTIEKIDFALPRGAVISGRVFDEFGEPMTDVRVAAMRYQFIQGRRQLVPAGRTATTDDVGEYRVFGLPPGQYYLSALLQTANALDVVTADRSGYAPTYYPGTANVSEAQRLTIEIGQTQSGVDLTLLPTRLARLTGTVIDADGKPLSGGMLMMLQTGGGMFMTGFGGGQIKPDGSFTISNVAPGEYTLVALNPQGGFVSTGMPEQIAANVTVAGEDINGLRLAGVKPSTMRGRILLPQAAAGSIRPATLQVSASGAQPTPFGGAGVGRVNDDLTFEMKVQPGRQLIRVALVQGATLKAVRVNGADVTDSGIEFRPNEDVSDVEIELTTDQSEVSGIVLDARGQPTKDYSVVVFAKDPQRWTIASRYFGGGRPDQDGRFKVRNLPAGQYYAIALDYLEPGAGTDPEFLERVRGRATEFSLTDGQVRTLDLRLASGL
jgi:hypothetical protein